MPTPLLLLAGFIVVILIVAVLVLKGRLTSDSAQTDLADTNSYALLPTLLSPAERSFLGVLAPLLPPHVTCLMKVRLGDVFVTRKGLGASRRTRARNRINQKHIDFLLVRASDFQPLAGIELDDRSHAAEDRQRRDTFVDGIFAECRLPLLHVPVGATYHPAELQASIAKLLTPPNSG